MTPKAVVTSRNYRIVITSSFYEDKIGVYQEGNVTWHMFEPWYFSPQPEFSYVFVCWSILLQACRRMSLLFFVAREESLGFVIVVPAVLVHDTEGGSECSSHNPETSDGGETKLN
jgi:hypothetical protein